ncbi:MAG: Asp-tRNA(Asn)/Glu-tRNA(Gln) amidotransferase subunit GatB [Acidimicrobiales bacterium]
MSEWETVIGLEVHCELATATKLFCGCPNRFGDEPNTNICPVCLGLPGSLPVLNRQSVEFAIRLGEALHCSVAPSVFARKNYFYPDMPKDYQISQYDLPINREGWLELPSGQRIGIVRAHLEEDTGKSTHVGGGGRIHEAAYSLVDYNRSGVPLLEIVSEPDLRSPEGAAEYVTELRAILLVTGVSDARMEEGSLRIDANVSVRPVGREELGTRCEIKNLNSLRSMRKAIGYEARRQAGLIEAGDEIVQETRHWDDGEGRTQTLRTKEEAEDYRYFAEPDLVPLVPDAEWVARVRAELPPLPADRRARLARAAGVESSDRAVAITVTRDLDRVALAAVERGADPGRVLTHIANDLAVEGAERLEPTALATLVRLETEGKLNPTQAKVVLAELVANGGGGDPIAIAAEKGFETMGASALEAVVDEAIAAEPDAWAKFVAGDGKAKGALVGYVMQKTDRKADGRVVNELLEGKRLATSL